MLLVLCVAAVSLANKFADAQNASRAEYSSR
jgi:hypothetical protein